jgi:serine/threonine-protein kinase
MGAPRIARKCPSCAQAFSGEARFCPFDGDPLIEAPDWSPTADPFIGRVIDARYEVTAVIGEGGMGTVYEVKHATLGRKFALKLLRRDIADPTLAERFVQEAKIAAAIGHPNIVAVNDFGTIAIESGGAVPYFVMEHLTGLSLSMLLRDAKVLAPGRAAGIALQCANGLAAAHAAGVVHRDLKPDNVFLVRGTEREYVKLLDFGVAKMVGTGRLTKAGMVFGTPHYMSPEQAQGQSVDHRADIYALGVILYECLAGRLPFEADTYMGVLTKHMFAVPEPLESIVPDPQKLGALGPIVARCLAKEPSDRYATMSELVAALEVYVKDPARAAAEQLGGKDRAPDSMRLREVEAIGADGRVSLLGPPVQSYRGALLFAGAAVLVAIGVVAWRLTSSSASASPAASASSAAATNPPTSAPRSSAPAAAAPPASGAAATPPTAASSSAEAAAPATTTAPEATAHAAEPRPDARRPRSPTPPKKGRRAGDVVDPWAH